MRIESLAHDSLLQAMIWSLQWILAEARSISYGSWVRRLWARESSQRMTRRFTTSETSTVTGARSATRQTKETRGTSIFTSSLWFLTTGGKSFKATTPTEQSAGLTPIIWLSNVRIPI